MALNHWIKSLFQAVVDTWTEETLEIGSKFKWVQIFENKVCLDEIFKIRNYENLGRQKPNLLRENKNNKVYSIIFLKICWANNLGRGKLESTSTLSNLGLIISS